MPDSSATPASQAHRIRVVVVDDEDFNRLRIEDLLHREDGVEVVGSAADGFEAIDVIRALRPDLVFLDVQMPEKTGLDVVREIGPAMMPATIFVTAYDRYAAEAFDVAAVDYLVKPFDDERFEQALRRARRALALGGIDGVRDQLLALLDASGGRPTGVATHAAVPEQYLERIPVESRGTVRPIPVNDIDYITASGPYAELFVGGRRYLIREAMQTLAGRLDPARFMRVHRSVIIRLDLIEGLKRGAGGDGEVLLKTGVKLRVSRTRREALERWLGLSP